MKKSGYRTTFHIYFIFLLTLIGTILSAILLFFLLITVRKPDGSYVRSDWPKAFTESFGRQIQFTDGTPRVTQAGIELLQDNGVGLQILAPDGLVAYSYGKPDFVSGSYSAFTGTVQGAGEDCVYILYFPMKISAITMYLNGDRFSGGRSVILTILCVLFLVILISGALYGFWTSRQLKRLTASIQDISLRRYLTDHSRGAFEDLYASLNTLDAEIRASDRLREETEKMREEWISNITHDLKTPLSPIKGYAEIIKEGDAGQEESYRRYAAVMLKNAAYMEALIDDLKLTYQLENGLIPVSRENQNMVRYLKELAIDILNTPEYEDRVIGFDSTEDAIFYSFDEKLLTRAFRNLIINAFVHGGEAAEVTLRIISFAGTLLIQLADNGKGIGPEEAEHLFDRYYRGSGTDTGTGEKPEGTGLGLAIAKSIIELHGGTITAAGTPGVGTVFSIEFPVS
ncbi:signal transduction histidine kinase [Hungatella effluvii]|uniref:histidine kinase n=1 Tax=Hungatella effluvii TaxID=1096246 RepID=A0A2V3Y1C7_9FIRM|nr:HAMP domain-containing sensor histidine kinase [Hungatella effluvii]PXX51921.1 signal transduction histidine kinase [Hungatella effluvii]